MRAVDASRYSTNDEVIPQSAFDVMKQQHIQLAIVGSWHGTEGYTAAEPSLIDARRNGLFTATYAALSPNHSGEDAIIHAQALCGSEWSKLKFCAVDVETPGITHDQVAEACSAVAKMGQTPIIYTSRGFWQNEMNDTPDFAKLGIRLWDAHYTGVDAFTLVPYGGWTMATLAGDQYTNTTSLDSIDVDYSEFSDDWILGLTSSSPLGWLKARWVFDMDDLSQNAKDLDTTVCDMTRFALHTAYTAERYNAWKALLGGGK